MSIVCVKIWYTFLKIAIQILNAFARKEGGKICKYFDFTASASNAQMIFKKLCHHLTPPFHEEHWKYWILHESHDVSIMSILKWTIVTIFRKRLQLWLKHFQVHVNSARGPSSWFQQQNICIKEREEKVRSSSSYSKLALPLKINFQSGTLFNDLVNNSHKKFQCEFYLKPH